ENPANLIRIRQSRNALIEGIMLRDPASWNTHILYSENVVIRNVKILNDRDVPNTDGIDPDASKHVLIDHCFAYCSDDNIAIKSSNNGGLLGDVDDITVKDCIFLTKKSSLKIGTETKASIMKNILFENNDVIESDRGMALYCSDGAVLDSIRFVNNRFERNFPDSQKKGIHFVIKNRSGAGEIRNVLVKDCTFLESFPKPSELTGLDKDHTITNVLFDHLIIAGKICTTLEEAGIKTNEFTNRIELKN
ncbi:MAG TPA: glycosyl hydrolase family 28 protein, partial [Bacteroidales bacterium]